MNYSKPKDFAKLLKQQEEKKFYLQPDMRIETLARMMNTNRTYLCEYLHGVAHTSFPDYLNDLRIKEALPLLENGTKNAGQIAFMVGFNSEYTFRRIFKDKYGMTPRVYAIKHRNNL